MNLFKYFFRKNKYVPAKKEWEEFLFNPFALDENGNGVNSKINDNAVTTDKLKENPFTKQ